MKPIGCVLWGSALTSIFLAVFKSPFIWVAAVLLGVALALLILQRILYRPTENHVATVYRFGRLGHLVGPDEWTYVIPGMHEVKTEMALRPRRAEASLTDLWTTDQIPVDCDLLVFYLVDLRHARAGFRAQALTIPDDGWNSMVRSVIQEAAGQAVGDMRLDELLSSAGRAGLKSTLSAELAGRLKDLGIVVNPQTGVSVQRVKPARTVWDAMADLGAAETLGEATVRRLHPMLEELDRRGAEVALEMLLLELAAAVAKDGTAPQSLRMSEQAAVLAALLGRSSKQIPINQPTNGKAAPDGDGRYQMELPLGLE